jgi:hypothetical protein
MNNPEMIATKGRNMFFFHVGACCTDVLEYLPGQVQNVRVIIETDKGHRLVELPLETGDEEFARTLVTGILRMSSAKCTAEERAADGAPR